MAEEDKLIINATVGDLAKAVARHLGLALTENELPIGADPNREADKHFVYGYAGLGNLLQLGKTSVYKILKSGIIDAAVIQKGKLLMVDSDLALDLLKRHKQNVKKRKR